MRVVNLRKVGMEWMRQAAFFMALTAVLVLGSEAAAQQIETTAQLKRACETSSTNTVVVNQPMKISNGVRPPGAEVVTTGCTLQMGPSALFEADQVSMTFNGPFVVQGSTKASVLFVESIFKGTSVNLNLTGSESVLIVDESRLQATAGNLTINTGAQGKLEIKEELKPEFGGGTLEATGAISITGGNKFTGILVEALIEAGTSLTIAMDGPEAVFKSLKANLFAMGGISISSPGAKGLVEISLAGIIAGSGLNIMLTGNESNLKAVSATLDGGTGSINIQSGGSSSLGKLAMGSNIIGADGSVTIQASFLGNNGGEIMEKNNITAGGDLRLETGNLGNTIVKENILTSTTLIRVGTGTGGKCGAEKNSINAPVQQICQ